MAVITLDTKNAQRKLDRIGSRLSTRQILNAIGLRHLKWINDNFKAAGLEKPWRPLAPNTIAGRRAGSSSPLQDTGRLRQSFTHRVVNDKAVEVGSTNKLAEIHHGGTGRRIIRPVNARALRFPTTEGIRFAKFVNHPGIPARPLLPSRRLAKRLGLAVFNRMVDKAIADGSR